MTGLKKTLLLLLAVCTLGYGSAWAFDSHAIDIDNGSQRIESQLMVNVSDFSLNDQAPETYHSKVSCSDHCGHISAHLQAIFTQREHLSSVNLSSELHEYSEFFISYITRLDLRPPRV